jgi:lysophospholipase L1-like esterase
MNVLRVLRPPLAAGALLAGQLVHAVMRDDLPTLENQDPSGEFGSPENPLLTIVFLGDSSVTAPGVEPLDHSWPRQLALHLANRFHVHAHSVAVGGSKIHDVLVSQVGPALALEPDIVYLSVGSNDALRGTPIQRFENDYGEVIARLNAGASAVGVSGIGDLGTIPRLPELLKGIARIRARAVNRAVARVAASYERTVKSNAWDVMESAFDKEPELFGEDLFHASAQGHLLFATVARPMADRLVEIWLSGLADQESA